MHYQYTYKNTAKDLWQLSMYYTYGSMVGVCNIVFTVAMALLLFARWNEMNTIYRMLVLLGVCMFPVIQPLAVYRKARKQAAAIQGETTVQFADAAVYVTQGSQHEELPWKRIRRVAKKPTLVVVFSDTTHGFVLPDRVLGAEKQEFYEYVSGKIGKA